MKLRRDISALVLVLCTASTTYYVTRSAAQPGAMAPQAIADNEYQAGATLYMQKAGEYRALAYQAFNLAHWQLDDDLDKKNVKQLPKAEQKKPRAVVVDIDETLLDNSPAQAYNIKNRLPFNIKQWFAWGEMRSAKAIPGAVDFLNYAVSKGVKVFFVSNRDEVQKQATMDNLKNVGFRDISSDNVLLRQVDPNNIPISTKEPRRQFILQKYRIVLLMGDNLDDLSDVFEKRTVADRFAEVDKAKNDWGKRWIVLPNAMYGTWENAIYDYGRLTEAQKAEKRAAGLELP
ncbi:MAG: 5'-nucleotidase, lipoprotein e(P4) family [Pyrinomonadaceae bacterium]